MKVPDTGKIISIVYLGAALIGVYLVYKIFSGIGLIKTGERKREDKARTEAETNLREAKYFNPSYLSDKLDYYKPLGNPGITYTKELRKAIAGSGTDEEKIFSIFGRLNNKMNISEISLQYRKGYNRDLLSDLLNDLTEKEQLTLWNIINKLPEK
jgi:hypothetical protein